MFLWMELPNLLPHWAHRVRVRKRRGICDAAAEDVAEEDEDGAREQGHRIGESTRRASGR